MKKAASYLPYYVVCILLASALWRTPTFLLVAYVGLSVIMLWRWHAIDDIVFYAVPSLLGPLGEVVAIYHGAWRYAEAPMLVPVWLPFAWGCAALYMKRTSDAVTERLRRTSERATGPTISIAPIVAPEKAVS